MLLAKLADFFNHQLPLSVPAKQRDQRTQLPTIMLSGSIDDIPEGLAGLGERQLFTLIENTGFGACKRDPTNVEKRLHRSEGQARASAPPAGRRGRSPAAFTPEPKAKAGRGRSASPFVGGGRGTSSSARPTTLIETRQPGVLLARPPPPPPVRNVTDYITAEEWDGIRSGAYGNYATRERTRSRTRAEASSAAEPAEGIPAQATPPGAGDCHGQQQQGLQNVPRSADNIPIGRSLQIRDRLLQVLDDHFDHDQEFRYTFPYDFSGQLFAPGQPRPDNYTRVEAYIWSVLRARDDIRIPLDCVITCLPDAEDPNRVWPVPSIEQVHWYWNGWSQYYTIEGQRRQAY